MSALGGFDFPDDSRSIAVIDWDRDGDLDAWITNRTAPMVRYLSNDTPDAGRSLLLKLEGKSAGRDAAGARAEVRLKGQPDKPVMRTVKLGEGYLGQSSRWLHLGLGPKPEIESVAVTWPGGTRMEVGNCRPGTAVSLTEGEPEPRIEVLTSPSAPAKPAPLPVRRAELRGAVRLYHPAVFPPLSSVDPSGKPLTVTDSGGPLLISVFASWCPDCAAELKAWRDHAAAFQSAGLRVMLLTADGRDTAHDTGPAEAWAWLRANNIPFPAGTLSDEAFRRLTTAHRQQFGAVVDLPIPAGFLLDGRGRLTAIYRGPVGADRILADAAAASTAGATVDSALPFPGRWLQVPDSPDPSFWISDLAGRQSWDEAYDVFQRHLPRVRLHRDFALIAGSLAEKLAAAGRHGAAIAAGSAAVEKSPDAPGLLNNLAGLLATAPDPALRDPAKALTLAKRAVELTGGRVPAILDTMAAAQAAGGDFASAAVTAGRAVDLARAAGDTALLPALERARSSYQSGKLPPPAAAPP